MNKKRISVEEAKGKDVWYQNPTTKEWEKWIWGSCGWSTPENGFWTIYLVGRYGIPLYIETTEAVPLTVGEAMDLLSDGAENVERCEERGRWHPIRRYESGLEWQDHDGEWEHAQNLFSAGFRLAPCPEEPVSITVTGPKEAVENAKNLLESMKDLEVK